MKKQVMIRAWEIYRSLVGDKIAKLSYAMRQAWAEVKVQANEGVYGGEYGKMTEGALDKLIEMGASRWVKAGRDRLYLNEAAEKIAGLEIERYKSGNICYAAFCGEVISNSKGRQAVYSLSNIYIDMLTGKVCNTDSSEYSEKLLENIRAYVA